MINIPLDICSGMSHITYIHIRDKNPAILWWKYVLGGVGGSDWAVSALLMNTIAYWTWYNNKKCAYTLMNDGARLILAHYHSRVPWPWALSRFLNNSHILASSSHIMIIFTYLETPPSHLSSYVHSILLCYLPLMKCQTCVALLIRALTNFARLSSYQHNNSTTHCQRRESGILTLLGNYVALWTLLLLSGTACLVFFFVVLWNSWQCVPPVKTR